MKMIAASVRTAIMVSVMISTAKSAEQNLGITRPDIFGVDVAFMVMAVLTIIELIVSFYIENDKGEGKSRPSEQLQKMNKTKKIKLKTVSIGGSKQTFT